MQGALCEYRNLTASAVGASVAPVPIRLYPRRKESNYKLSGKCLLGQDDGMNTIRTMCLYLALQQAPGLGDAVRGTGDAPPDSILRTRRKHTVPCEP